MTATPDLTRFHLTACTRTPNIPGVCLTSPADVVEIAVAALSRGEWDLFLDSFDPVGIARAMQARRTMQAAAGQAAENAARGADGPRNARRRASLVEARAAAREALMQLPAKRATLRCEVTGSQPLGESKVIVRYRLWWGQIPQARALEAEVELRAVRDRWVMEPSLLSRWMIPGFENVLVSERYG